MKVQLFPVGLISRVSVALVATLVFAVGCGSSGAKKTPSCVHQSDCSGNLMCTQGYCVGMCATAKDCGGARCVEAAEGPTCQPTEKVTCNYNSDCTQPLICSGDFQCRNQCHTAADCTRGQVCTALSKLCADPSVDTNYDPATMDFKHATAAFGAGIVAPDGGVDASTDGAGSDAETGDGATADGTSSDGATKDGAVVDVPGQPEVGIAASCPGTPLTLFGKIATGDANSNYGSGVGIRLPAEMAMFYGFTGYDDVPDGGADAGPTMGPYVNRIDYQRFDLTGKAKGPAQRLAVVEGGNDTGFPALMLVDGVTAAPTGEVAIIYDAGTGGGGAIYLKLLAPDTLAVSQTIQLQSFQGTRYGLQAHVQWEAGQFVASWVSYNNDTATSYLNLAKFLKDGTPTGSSNSIPTNDNATVRNVNYEQASAAFVSNTFAISYEAANGDFPYLTFLGTDGNQIGQTLALPYSTTPTSQFTVVGATTQGFVAVYNGQIPASDAGGPAATPFATLATFVSTPGADGGVVGTTVALPGLAAYNQQNGARSSSDALGAGFALLTADGKAAFAYFTDDGSKHLGPSQIIQQMNASTPSDEVHLMNLNGSYAISLFSNAEHLTRMSVSGCPVTTN